MLPTPWDEAWKFYNTFKKKNIKKIGNIHVPTHSPILHLVFLGGHMTLQALPEIPVEHQTITSISTLKRDIITINPYPTGIETE